MSLRYTNLGESDAYRAAREALREAELELVDHVERVAAMRRSLPPGPVVEDYVLGEGVRPLTSGDDTGRDVRLAELFTGVDRPLVVYHLMFGKQQAAPCPMCTMWVDGFNGVAGHVGQRADLAVVAAADLPSLRAHGRDRGWENLRLVSAATSSFKRDLESEDDAGHQFAQVSVFSLDADGSVRHRYSGSPTLSGSRSERGIDALCPTWSLLDLTPQGRGEWYASLSYD